MTTSADDLSNLETPCLVIDETKMNRNIERLKNHLAPFDVILRPHLKTAKSVEVARRLLTNGDGPATVSTLLEAETFAAAGVSDILYAVGIAPQKLQRVMAIRSGGCDLSIVLDSETQADAVIAVSRTAEKPIPVFIEIDSDGHRGGLAPDDDKTLIRIGKMLHENGAELRGVLTHAGESYGAYGKKAQADFAEQERAAVVLAAQHLRNAGLSCPVVSVGSTPTAHAVQNLDGVTEVRAGVYVFFDLVMAGIGVCKPDDIALSVLTTVIGHQRDKGWILVDAGWMAMSRDRGTAAQPIDQGYGVVCTAEGQIMPDLYLGNANQEHGIISLRPESGQTLPDLPIGTRLRVLPNHACATAAQYSGFNVVQTDVNAPVLRWSKVSGW